MVGDEWCVVCGVVLKCCGGEKGWWWLREERVWELKLKSAGFIYLVAAEFEILQHNTNEASYVSNTTQILLSLSATLLDTLVHFCYT